jgi:hypothetical protein
LQVIRTLMERSAVYRRALAPIMLLTGVLGLAGAAGGYGLRLETPPVFAGYWMALSLVALAGAFLLARREALQVDEPFWSPPTRRVTQALVPPLFVGMVGGMVQMFPAGGAFLPAPSLPALWMLLYGCALQSAGFFMQRGIKLFGWLFILSGTALTLAMAAGGNSPALRLGHLAMGVVFGGLHLAYGSYLYFTEPRKKP